MLVTTTNIGLRVYRNGKSTMVSLDKEYPKRQIKTEHIAALVSYAMH